MVGGLLHDRLPHAGRLADHPGRAPRPGVLLHEGVDRLLLALDGALADALGHDVQHHHPRTEALGEVAADPHGQLGVRPAAHRHQDRPDLVQAALLDDGDVARRLAHDRVDGR